MIKIGSRFIGEGYCPFIIAEMSGNHNQSLERALAIVNAAADAGAHAIKLQTYTADTMTVPRTDGDFFISDPLSQWKDTSLYDLYKKACTPWEWHKALFDHAKKRGLIAFSSPFDETSVDFLEDLNVPAYKIASFENTHHPLLKKVASTGKPVIMSTGLATLEEIQESVEVLRSNGCKELILLKCTSAYPASPASANLLTIPHIAATFNCVAGLSDHTLGTTVAVAATALGACVIEKHLTLRRADGGVDSEFSLEPEELKQLVNETHNAWLATGKPILGPTESEINSLKFRRSIFIVKDVKAGETLTADNTRVIRPATGLAPKFYETVIGKIATTDLTSGTPLTWELIN